MRSVHGSAREVYWHGAVDSKDQGDHWKRWNERKDPQAEHFAQREPAVSTSLQRWSWRPAMSYDEKRSMSASLHRWNGTRHLGGRPQQPQQWQTSHNWDTATVRTASRSAPRGYGKRRSSRKWVEKPTSEEQGTSVMEWYSKKGAEAGSSRSGSEGSKRRPKDTKHQAPATDPMSARRSNSVDIDDANESIREIPNQI